jgi:DNA polymerase-1
MPVDVVTLREVGEEIDEQLTELEARIYEEVGHPFNIGSPKQLAEVLFVEMGLPHGRKTKTGYSTDAKVLQQLAIEHPIAERIITYRELSKLKGTYIEGLMTLSPPRQIVRSLSSPTTLK